MELETAHFISATLVVLESRTAKVVLSSVAVLGGGHISNSLVKFRITSPDPSAWSFAENVISAAEMELKARLLML